MEPNLTKFSWSRFEPGYRWFESGQVGSQAGSRLETSPYYDRQHPQFFLTEARPGVGRESPGSKSFDPLAENTGLFHTFAYTQPTQAGVLAFANQFGRLGEGVEVGVGNAEETLMGEPLPLWQAEILAMRQLLDLWQLVREGNKKDIGRHVHWSGKESAWYDSESMDDAAAKRNHPASALPDDFAGRDPFLYPARGTKEREPHVEPQGTALIEQAQFFHFDLNNPVLRTRAIIASPLINSDVRRNFFAGDVVAPACFYLQRAVNWRMQGLVDVRLVWDADDNRGRLHLVPKSLLGALWVQFALAINGDKEYRECGHCSTWFELSPGTARTSRFYCSDACKMKAYRERKNSSRPGIRSLSERRKGK